MRREARDFVPAFPEWAAPTTRGQVINKPEAIGRLAQSPEPAVSVAVALSPVAVALSPVPAAISR